MHVGKLLTLGLCAGIAGLVLSGCGGQSAQTPDQDSPAAVMARRQPPLQPGPGLKVVALRVEGMT